MNYLPCQMEVITERKWEKESASIPNTPTVLQGKTNRNNASSSWMTSYPCLSFNMILFSLHSPLSQESFQKQCREFSVTYT